MRNTGIKICGLMRGEDVLYVNEVSPEYIGFIFVRDRRRYVSPKTAKLLRSQLKPGITAVGVFINEDPRTVAELWQSGLIDMAQLHGQEDEQYIKDLRSLTSLPLIKAFRVESKEDIERAEQSSADYILLDNGIGGTGSAFDWSLLAGVKREYFLAGGLNAENVSQAISFARPFAVDVSSGVETDGKKDFQKIRAFVRSVREEDSRMGD